jgi:hypothetical protein
MSLRRNSSANFVFPGNLDNDCRWGFALISMRCGAYFNPLALHEMGDDEPIQSKAYSSCRCHDHDRDQHRGRRTRLLSRHGVGFIWTLIGQESAVEADDSEN